ncbi:MAG: sugar ABC transporter substrate-binding protein [Dorea sp.]|jgi:ribose transport system substrate-binding protein|nr:sugar ABC transporter substrate-binding protein [Dorea sp.]
MKKRILAALLILSVIGLMLAGCADTRDDGTVKVGISIQSLSNAYWAGVMGKLEEQMEARGWDYTIVGCENNAGTQVGQVENFIISGCDLIMVHPADAESLEGICGEAMEADIKVMCWDDPMENTTANWVLDNTDLGREIGKTAAEFINGHYTEDEKAQVTVIGYPSTKVLLERADGIKEGLEESCEDNYEIIAEVDGLEAPEAQTNVETVMSAHPDANVFVGVCAGAMIGSNEALLAEFGKGNIPDNYGVITTDVTQQQLDSLEAGNEAVRAIVGFEGSNEDTAKACAEMFARILSGEDFSSDRNVYREIAPITLENVEEIQKGM